MALEKELLNGINLMREGKEEGFNILYSHTYNFVYGRARMIMKNEEDALDLTQETFIQAYKGIHSLENPENIYAWLGSIAYRQGMKIFRKKQEVLVDEEAEGIFENIVSADKDTQPEESAEAKATSKIIMDLVEELPELQRAAVVAFYYDNMKIDDIAKAFECSSNTIKSRLNYAKKFLKTKVEEHQRQNNYRLCSFSPALLLMALRAMFATEKYTLSATVAGEVYSAACGALGLVASAGVAGAVTAAEGAGTFAKLAAGWTAKKTAVAIALSTVAIATAVVVPQLTELEAPPVVEMVIPTDTPAPTNTPTPGHIATSTLTPTPTPEYDYYANTIDEYYEIVGELVREGVTEAEVCLHKVTYEEGHDIEDAERVQRYAGMRAGVYWDYEVDEITQMRCPPAMTEDGQYYVLPLGIYRDDSFGHVTIYAYSEEDYVTKLRAALDSRLTNFYILLLGNNQAELEEMVMQYGIYTNRVLFPDINNIFPEEGYMDYSNDYFMPVNIMLRERFAMGMSYERVIYLQENELAAEYIDIVLFEISAWYEEKRTPWVKVYLPIGNFYHDYWVEHREYILENKFSAQSLSNAVWYDTAKEYYSDWFNETYPDSGYIMEFEPIIIGRYKEDVKISNEYMTCIIRQENVEYVEPEKEVVEVDVETLFPSLTPIPQVQQIPKKDISEVDANVLAREIIADIISDGMSETEKVKAIHDYMVMHIDIDYINYVFGTLLPERSMEESALGIGYASPEGYAETFKLLCTTAGVECIVVDGILMDGEKAHTWNQVKIDGNWYHVDVMSDDPGRTTKKQKDHRLASYQYFLVSDEDMSLTHTLVSEAQTCQSPSIANEALVYGCPWEVAGVVSSMEEIEKLVEEMLKQETTYFKYVSDVEFSRDELAEVIENIIYEKNLDVMSWYLTRTVVPQKVRNGKEYTCYYIMPNLVEDRGNEEGVYPELEY